MALVMTPHEINKRTYEIPPRPLGAQRGCDYCGSQLSRHLFSYETRRACMYVARSTNRWFDSSRSISLCDRCWPNWLLWRARIGFDLHTHSRHETCGLQCFASRGGRRAQVEAQMSLLRNPNVFFVQKTIDRQPYVNGSPAIMALRTFHFLFRRLERQKYYESSSSPEDVRRQMRQVGQLHTLGISRPLLQQVMIVVDCFESWYDAPGGTIQLPKSTDHPIGRHCVLLTGYEDNGETLSFVNSWGRSWGKNGFGTLRMEYLEGHLYEAFVVHRARYGPSPRKLFGPDDTIEDVRRRFSLENPRERTHLRAGNGETWVIELFETMSTVTDEPAFGIEVSNGFGLRMGWLFLKVRTSLPRVHAEITELFVWPTFRRMGIGKLLEDTAIHIAGMWEASEIRLMLNEADSIAGLPQATALAFGRELGYEWSWRVETAPRRPATAVKLLSK